MENCFVSLAWWKLVAWCVKKTKLMFTEKFFLKRLFLSVSTYLSVVLVNFSPAPARKHTNRFFNHLIILLLELSLDGKIYFLATTHIHTHTHTHTEGPSHHDISDQSRVKIDKERKPYHRPTLPSFPVSLLPSPFPASSLRRWNNKRRGPADSSSHFLIINIAAFLAGSSWLKFCLPTRKQNTGGVGRAGPPRGNIIC